jgi:hypothetical protein
MSGRKMLATPVQWNYIHRTKCIFYLVIYFMYLITAWDVEHNILSCIYQLMTLTSVIYGELDNVTVSESEPVNVKGCTTGYCRWAADQWMSYNCTKKMKFINTFVDHKFYWNVNIMELMHYSKNKYRPHLACPRFRPCRSVAKLNTECAAILRAKEYCAAGGGGMGNSSSTAVCL